MVSPYSCLFPYSDLAVAYPHLDTNALTELLARAMFVAEAWGRISAQGEMG
jgi:phage gp29-like protein